VIGFLATVAGGVASTDLTPASGCQDHTSSPSASSTLVRSTIRVHRIQAPRWWRCATPLWVGLDGGEYRSDLGLL